MDLLKDDLPRFHFVVIEHIIYESKKMVTRKAQRFKKIYLILTGIALHQEIGDPDNFIQRGSDLMAHCRHEDLFCLGCFFCSLSCSNKVIKHYPPLNGNCYLVGNKVENIKVILGEFIFIVVVLEAHNAYNVIFHSKRYTHPYLAWRTHELYFIGFLEHLQVIFLQQDRLIVFDDIT